MLCVIYVAIAANTPINECHDESKFPKEWDATVIETDCDKSPEFNCKSKCFCLCGHGVGYVWSSAAVQIFQASKN
jgi:hypothetical protein